MYDIAERHAWPKNSGQTLVGVLNDQTYPGRRHKRWMLKENVVVGDWMFFVYNGGRSACSISIMVDICQPASCAPFLTRVEITLRRFGSRITGFRASLNSHLSESEFTIRYANAVVK